MISVDLIKKLRELTGAGVADCRQVLAETGGDIGKAAELLKQRGAEKAAKKLGRETGQGQVFTYLHATGKVGVVLSLLCETDFVAATADFQNLGKELCLQIAAMNPKNTAELLKQEYIRDVGITVHDMIKQAVGRLGENIKMGEFARIAV